MGKSLKMKNAPVYYVLAQARHNPVLQLDPYLPEIQDRMRKAGYPDHQATATLAVELNFSAGDGQPDAKRMVPKSVARHLFLSADRSKGFIFEQGALSLQTMEYDTFEPFLEEFMVGFGIVHDVIKLDYTERIGIRYLDAVLPAGGPDDLRRYLIPGVLGLAGELPEGVQVGLSMSETHIPLTDVDANLVSRTIVRSGPLGFPIDLEPQGLAVPERFQKVHGLHAIIDTDASQAKRHSIDLTDLRSRLDMLHTKIRMAFDATVTVDALDEWQ
jgi:uncharacterized protein (TIGR04255 family)